MSQMMNDIGAKDNRFGMLVSDPTTGRPCKYGAVLEVSSCTDTETQNLYLLPRSARGQFSLGAAVLARLGVLASRPVLVFEQRINVLASSVEDQTYVFVQFVSGH